MRFDSREAFLSRAEHEWESLWEGISGKSPREISRRPRGTDANTLAWSIKDIVAHLYGWHRLTLGWYRIGLDGTPALPADGFNWRQTRELNRLLYNEFKALPWVSVSRRVKLSHRRVMRLVESLSDQQFLTPGAFAWTRRLPLSSFIVPNTISHYRWAERRIRTMAGSVPRS